jgi:hypothetical protein
MTAPTLDEKRPYTYNGDAGQRLASFFDGYEGDSVKSIQIMEQTGVSRPTVNKFLRDMGWEMTGKGNASVWMRTEAAEVEFFPEGEQPVVERPEQVEEAKPDKLADALSDLLAAPEETTVHEAEPVDDSYALGEAAGYEQAHNELQPQIDRLKEKLHDKVEELNGLMESSLMLVEQHEALKLSFDNKVKELEESPHGCVSHCQERASWSDGSARRVRSATRSRRWSRTALGPSIRQHCWRSAASATWRTCSTRRAWSTRFKRVAEGRQGMTTAVTQLKVVTAMVQAQRPASIGELSTRTGLSYNSVKRALAELGAHASDKYPALYTLPSAEEIAEQIAQHGTQIVASYRQPGGWTNLARLVQPRAAARPDRHEDHPRQQPHPVGEHPEQAR